ncbi:hypothetical protein [Cellulomonas septica]|uniref:Uncharacterized protein n=1 Tax=Cellulomonas septica TaxID=285080 RepID=A0ABX1JWZ9_9CELL|nr:hypothetical protein [Cellulomonas septica]NKY38848.1 hypothetical protein [Cellulomonas septica]
MTRLAIRRQHATALTFALVTLVLPACTTPAPDDAVAPTTAPTDAAPTTAVTTPDAATPTATPSWPTALPEDEAMSATDSYSVVWLVIAPAQDAALAAADERAEQLGYSAPSTPVVCVPPAPAGVEAESWDDAWGAPVYFREPQDAELFAELWGAPVAAVVHDVHLACGWG